MGVPASFETVYREEVFRCIECDDFELHKTFRGTASTPGETEYDQIEAPEECPICGGSVEHEVVA